MSGIALNNTLLLTLSGSHIKFFVSAAPGVPAAYQFNSNVNSMLLPTLAAWPLSPLVVP